MIMAYEACAVPICDCCNFIIVKLPSTQRHHWCDAMLPDRRTTASLDNWPT